MLIKKLNIKRTPYLCEDLLFNESISYAGIGSRETPLNIGEIMIQWAYYHSLEGFVLRSGGAEGADTFFEIGADLAKKNDPTKGKKQIFLPEKNFFKHNSPWYLDNLDIFETQENIDKLNRELMLVAGRFHPYLNGMNEVGRGLMLRNTQQVLGPYLNDPSMAIVCWTPDGAIDHEGRSRITGGTGQAISIASSEYIVTDVLKNRFVKEGSQQVLNLQRTEHLELVKKRILTLKEKYGEMPDWKNSLDWTPIYKPKNSYSNNM